AALAQEGYVTLEDIADRWDDPAAARTHGPRTLGFESGANGFTEQSSAFTAMRLFQAIKAAKDMTKNLYTPRSCITPGQGSSERSGLEALCDRQQLLTEWVKETGLPKPKLEAQGSDALLKTQFRFCSKGELGFINAKYIVSALPELEEKPFKTRRKVTVDGWDKEEEEEERKLPTTRRHLDRMHRVFRNNLSMCLLAFPQFTQFDVSKHDLDDWYDWFWGPDIAGRTPAPSERTLLYAERNAWRSIHNLVFEGKSLKEAMLEINADALFWLPGKGSWKGKQPWPAYQPVFQPFLKQNGKGKDTPGKKGDQKGKGKDAWPQNWSRNNPKGTPFCRDYHIKKQCAGNCGRSHNCPLTKVPLALSKKEADRRGNTGQLTLPSGEADQVPKDAIVMPFAGKDDAASLEAILHTQDLLDDALHGALCITALQGGISFVGACPDFHTWGKIGESPAPKIPYAFVVGCQGPGTRCYLSRQETLPCIIFWKPALIAGRLKGQHPLGRLYYPPNPRWEGRAKKLGLLVQVPMLAGDQVHAAPEIGSDRPSPLPLSERLSLDDATIKVAHGFKVRPLRGGGGKTSPGRLPPHFRTGADASCLGDFIKRKALPLVPEFLASTASGAKQRPFLDSVLKEIRDFILPQHSQPDAGQPFFLDVIHKLLEDIQDVDSGYPVTRKEGVPLGVDTPTLQSPGVWPLKSELIGEEWDPIEAPPPSGHKNYPSADMFRDEIRATFVEETPLGMVIGPCTRAEAAAHCQCAEEELRPCPMAGIDESDKIRSIFDGSKGGANLRIQQNTVGKTTAPTGLRTARSRSDPGAFGPEPPHRRIKVLLREWRYQVAQLGDEWWVNTVGTYGMASAQLYWGRMAAILLRLAYAVFPEVDWGFVFVDDFAWLLRKSSSSLLATSLCLLLLALGTPLSWKKTLLAEVKTWLGFVIDPKGPCVQTARDKHLLVMGILEELKNGKVMSAPQIASALGRLQWATTACPLTKPFLQPFWAWKKACLTAGRPGKLIRALSALLLSLFGLKFRQASPYAPLAIWSGASDASASDDGSAYVGGWLPNLASPSKSEVFWFHYQVTPEDHPWAFDKGCPKKRIATLEMFSTLVLAHFLMEKAPAFIPNLRIPLVSDNQKNVYSLLNDKSKKMPTSVILMEILLQLHVHGMQLAPSHVKRDFNTWADELTHPDFQCFAPSFCLPVKPVLGHFSLIRSILEDRIFDETTDLTNGPVQGAR
ncbi:MKK3, partial [Symbiodinium microadriaticum]